MRYPRNACAMQHFPCPNKTLDQMTGIPMEFAFIVQAVRDTLAEKQA